MAHGDRDVAWQPALRRVVLAFVVAPIVPSALVALVALAIPDFSYWSLLAATLLVGAYPAALILGVPLYLFLRRRVTMHWWVPCLAGGACASVPWVLIALVGAIIDGPMAGEDLIASLAFAALTFGLGAIGGAFFWLAVAAGGKRGQRGAGDGSASGRAESQGSA